MIKANKIFEKQLSDKDEVNFVIEGKDVHDGENHEDFQNNKGDDEANCNNDSNRINDVDNDGNIDDWMDDKDDAQNPR